MSKKTEPSRFEKLKEQFIKEGSKPGAEEKVKKSFFSYFKKNKHTISFGNQIEKIYDHLISGKLSKTDKAVIIGALLYFINPFDLLPDITPIVGFFDDMTVIGMVYRYLTNRSLEGIPAEDLETESTSEEASAKGPKDGGKKDNNA